MYRKTIPMDDNQSSPPGKTLGMVKAHIPRRIGVLLFDQFEPLDVFGPVELLGSLPDLYAVSFHAATPGIIEGSLGVQLLAEHPMDKEVDILLVPGGQSTRALVHDEEFIQRLRIWGQNVPLVASVCTGSALLAQAGLLDGYRATSNKRAFDWASSYGHDVEWVRQARWIADRNRWSSSGVAAGMDMAAALITELDGPAIAAEVCHRIELEVRQDPAHDPFA